MELNLEASISSPPDSPVNLTALQENVRRLVMSVTCGAKLSEYWAKRDQSGLWVRTSQDCFPLSVAVSLAEYSMTWPAWGIESAGAVGELPKSVRSTGAREFSLLPTPRATKITNENQESWEARQKDGKVATPPLGLAVRMLPTPQAFDALNFIKADLSDKTTKNGKEGGRANLREAFVMLATPAASQMHKPVRPLAPSERNGGHGQMLVGQIGEALNGSEPVTGERGTLNPSFVERMMGFPDGWTLPD